MYICHLFLFLINLVWFDTKNYIEKLICDEDIILRFGQGTVMNRRKYRTDFDSRYLSLFSIIHQKVVNMICYAML